LLSDRLEIISMPLHRLRSCWIRRQPFVKQRARVSSAGRTTGPLTAAEVFAFWTQNNFNGLTLNNKCVKLILFCTTINSFINLQHCESYKADWSYFVSCCFSLVLCHHFLIMMFLTSTTWTDEQIFSLSFVKQLTSNSCVSFCVGGCGGCGGVLVAIVLAVASGLWAGFGTEFATGFVSWPLVAQELKTRRSFWLIFLQNCAHCCSSIFTFMRHWCYLKLTNVFLGPQGHSNTKSFGFQNHCFCSLWSWNYQVTLNTLLLPLLIKRCSSSVIQHFSLVHVIAFYDFTFVMSFLTMFTICHIPIAFILPSSTQNTLLVTQKWTCTINYPRDFQLTPFSYFDDLLAIELLELWHAKLKEALKKRVCEGLFELRCPCVAKHNWKGNRQRHEGTDVKPMAELPQLSTSKKLAMMKYCMSSLPFVCSSFYILSSSLI